VSDYETYVVAIGTTKGRRYAKRFPLNIPLAAARGRYEDLSDRALNDLITDLNHERLRRFSA
jgi:hypothetical protein